MCKIDIRRRKTFFSSIIYKNRRKRKMDGAILFFITKYIYIFIQYSCRSSCISFMMLDLMRALTCWNDSPIKHFSNSRGFISGGILKSSVFTLIVDLFEFMLFFRGFSAWNFLRIYWSYFSPKKETLGLTRLQIETFLTREDWREGVGGLEVDKFQRIVCSQKRNWQHDKQGI